MNYFNSNIKIPKKNTCSHPTCGDTCRRPAKEKKIYIIKKIADSNEDLLEQWFQHRMKTCQPVCECCGAQGAWVTKEPYLKLWKAAQAHILPKRMFGSIATHPLNGFVMFAGYSGVCYCHDNFDASWKSASQMAIFPKAIERVKLLMPFIAEEEKKFLPFEILKHL